MNATSNQPESMEQALQHLLDPNAEFDIPLLDKVVSTAYDPTNPQRAAANDALMKLQENPDLWTKADGILERASNPQARFFGLQILDEAIKTR
jgi:exportin-1